MNYHKRKELREKNKNFKYANCQYKAWEKLATKTMECKKLNEINQIDLLMTMAFMRHYDLMLLHNKS